MLMEKVGLGPRQGKTKRAIEQVAEQLLLGNRVVYLTNELTYEVIKERVWEEAPDALLVNLVVEYCTPIEVVVSKYDDDVVIVADVLTDVSNIECANPLYVYYQVRNER